jgi:hypothetical protein
LSGDKNYQTLAKHGYSELSKCAIKRIYEFVDLIGSVDSKAIIVTQGEHDPADSNGFEKDYLNLSKDDPVGRFSIFNAIKLPNVCGVPTNNNVETVQLVFDCISGSKMLIPHQIVMLDFMKNIKILDGLLK